MLSLCSSVNMAGYLGLQDNRQYGVDGAAETWRQTQPRAYVQHKKLDWPP